jgi:hypothetical protein
MSHGDSTTACGRISAARADWFVRAGSEVILEPDLPVVDTASGTRPDAFSSTIC